MIERRMLRMRDMTTKTGLRKVTIYKHVQLGTLTKPVKLGERASVWPSDEIEMILAARIAGRSEVEIKSLVKQLMAARTAEPEAANGH